MISSIDKTLYQRPAELLQQLIRFDTTNPPGNEVQCIMFLKSLLQENGIQTTILAKDPSRPNLIARIPGKAQDQTPLLLYGHVDVVTPGSGKWTYPPFSGQIADGFVWGRGALDMKGAVAMMTSAFIQAKVENAPLPRDIVLCILSDEEENGEYGARFLVENHPQYFKDVRFALSEFGAFTLYIGGKRFYPIEVAQKQKCIIKAMIKGDSGHGSSYVKGAAMAKLARFLDQLDKNLLPVHITPVIKQMFLAIADALPFPSGWIMRQLTKPRFNPFFMKLLGPKGHAFIPLFHNTVNPTIVHGGDKINVIPGQIEVQLDVRILPGFTPQDVINELRSLIGNDILLEASLFDEGPDYPQMELFQILANIIKEKDPQGIPIPLMLTGSSDARLFSRLGIQTYGFMPMQLPPDTNFNRMIHSVDERIPVDTLQFGTNALYMAILSQ